ncbi:MAG: hypothetical protein OJK14_10700 [Achromobacter sp.]|uniref:hypothetical protein n=1 Tax=Achromobacter sp. TaxID=134375 RepID=UPI00258276C9|nr:hypothetical protein [Achromobacter sp.]MCW0207558.1 hypothetical protein [Achromobacter sp.]
MADDIRVTRGSGNVFADLGFENPEAELLQAQRLREERLDAALAQGMADSAAGRVTPLDEAFEAVMAAIGRKPAT